MECQESVFHSEQTVFFDVLNQLDLYPKEAVNGTELLFVNFGEKETAYCLPVWPKCVMQVYVPRFILIQPR